MHFGRHRQGEHVTLFCVTRNAAGTATVPTNAPQAVIFNTAGTKITQFRVPVTDKAGQTGVFTHALRLNSDYGTVGVYSVIFYYNILTFAGVDLNTFEIVAGGNADGSVIGLYYYDRPHGKFIVRQLDSGTVTQGRNPRL